MNFNNFIENNGIQQADAIIVKREKLGLFDHYVIFLGYNSETSEPVFIANFGKGVDTLTPSILLQYLKTYKPVSISRFMGSQIEREQAVRRALSDLKTKSDRAYHLIKNNCEHFANWVQKGVRESRQVKNAGRASIVGGASIAAIGLTSERKALVWTGAILTVLGGIVSLFSEQN